MGDIGWHSITYFNTGTILTISMNDFFMKRCGFLRLGLLVFLILLTACGDSEIIWDESSETGLRLANKNSSIAIVLTNEPNIRWDASSGKTTVVMHYIVRGDNDIPLSSEAFDIQLLIDEKKVDKESVLNASAQALTTNLYFSMVLDASYSMLTHQSPAFHAMLEAARNSYQEVLDIWSGRSGEVAFSLFWFNDFLNRNLISQENPQSWSPSDILSIPEPSLGDSTKLYGAVHDAGSVMKTAYDNGFFNGVRDHHVMMVFSDGGDNYSWFDNTTEPKEERRRTTSNAEYIHYGKQPVTIDDVMNTIKEHPALMVHVIGLGDNIEKQELKMIAEAGHGVYLKNPDVTRVKELFSRVTREFTTLQTQGALIPLPPGEYKFTVLATNKNGTKDGRTDFIFVTGDAQARVIKQ